MELKWFEDFLSVSQCYSFTRAASERNITQSALSRRIKQLEEWLGVPLFDRKTYPIRLTPEGQDFLHTAAELVFSMTQLRSDLRERHAQKHAIVHFAALNTLSLTFFPDWINQIDPSHQYGYIRLCDQQPSFSGNISLLLDGETDFLLTYAHDSVPLMKQLERFPYIELGKENALAVCAPDDKGKPLFPLHTFSGTRTPLPYLSYGNRSFFAHALTALFASRPLPLKPIYENPMCSGLKAMTVSGCGVSWLPTSLISEELASGSLLRAGERSWDIQASIRLYRLEKFRTPQAERLWNKASLLHQTRAVA
ncbi:MULTISPECIES: LysR family transcriptional regulator [Rahnella]|uniref:LysR family transcriptional regulator n=1 Tax=Rahnella TaxID=34037 RepID=UPI000E6C2D8B|nr:MULTISPECIES: LysR family transcriptional regulator [Rahnella]TBX30973.1 LysR family transcriptional regulator [Rahnella victoriana]TDS93088.1 LysR family transcriptional regulator [Rahnella sp. BIGb0236]UHM92306.1 LysR family transcriptional regulator [Rahnella victoriana]